jgi:hypothetical protein
MRLALPALTGAILTASPRWAWHGVATTDEVLVIVTAFCGIILATVALRLRHRDVLNAPDREARYVAMGRIRTNCYVLAVHLALGIHGFLRATQMRPVDLPLATLIAIYILPFASAFAMAVSINDLAIRRGVRRIRRHVDEP